MKSRFFFKIHVFVVFGSSFSDKQSLVFGAAFARNHHANSILSGFDVTIMPAAPKPQMNRLFVFERKMETTHGKLYEHVRVTLYSMYIIYCIRTLQGGTSV